MVLSANEDLRVPPSQGWQNNKFLRGWRGASKRNYSSTRPKRFGCSSFEMAVRASCKYSDDCRVEKPARPATPLINSIIFSDNNPVGGFPLISAHLNSSSLKMRMVA